MMPHTTLALVLAFLPVLYAQTNSSPLTNVTQAFSQAQIVPDVLPSFAPTALANITFPPSSTNQPLNVTPGALLTEPQTATEPAFSLISNSTSQVANQTFVLALVDPDAPSPQNRSSSQFLHFLGGDFFVNATSANPTHLVNRSAALMEFFPPTPPTGSPPHRYVLVVYTQPNNFADTSRTFVNASTPRNNFNLTTFATSTNLTNPVAGNFFFVGPADGTNTATSVAPTGTTPAGSGSGSGISSGGAPAPTNTTNGAIAMAPTRGWIGMKGLFPLAALIAITYY